MKCERCAGEGWLPPSEVFHDGSYYSSRECSTCQGTGEVSQDHVDAAAAFAREFKRVFSGDSAP